MFKSKAPSFGWYPTTAGGWLITLVYIGLVGWGAYMLIAPDATLATLLSVYFGGILATIIFIAIASKGDRT